MKRFSTTRARPSENTPLKAFLIALAVLTLTPAAHAGIVDSPIPAPFTKHVWNISGVVNSNGTGTIFVRTNVSASSVTLGVEVFGPAGGAAVNNAAAGATSVAPGATIIFGTVGFAGIAVDVNIGLPGSGGLGVVTKGSARVLATASSGVLCSTFLADAVSAPPAFATNLTIAKKRGQKGD